MSLSALIRLPFPSAFSSRLPPSDFQLRLPPSAGDLKVHWLIKFTTTLTSSSLFTLGIAHASMALRSLNHNLDHNIFFFGLALGNHKSERHESVIGKAFGAIGSVEDAVAIEEPEEEGSCNTFGDVATGYLNSLVPINRQSSQPTLSCRVGTKRMVLSNRQCPKYCVNRDYRVHFKNADSVIFYTFVLLSIILGRLHLLRHFYSIKHYNNSCSTYHIINKKYYLCVLYDMLRL